MFRTYSPTWERCMGLLIFFVICLQTVKAFLPDMLERNRGHIVTIASGAGMFGLNGLVDYCASKFAAVGFHESLDLELWKGKKTGLHTTVVCPFFINTGMFEGASTKLVNDVF